MAYRHRTPEQIKAGQATKGKGWGPGVVAFNKRRTKHPSKKMSASEFFTLRPRLEKEAAFFVIKTWCADNNIPMSALFNAILQPLSNAVQNTTLQNADGQFTIELNAGTVTIE
jgi:hypothetical protein